MAQLRGLPVLELGFPKINLTILQKRNYTDYVTLVSATQLFMFFSPMTDHR